MSDAQETPYRPLLQLLTGHFHETSGYRAYRKNGVADWLLIHTLSGRGRFEHAKGTLIAMPGDWVLLRPGTLHDYGVEAELQNWELAWAHFQPRKDWLPLLAWPVVEGGLMRLTILGAEGDRIARQFLHVHALANGSMPRREAFAMNAMEATLLACDAAAGSSGHDGDPRIGKAMSYLESRLAHKVLVDDVASAAGLSPSRLAHLFKQETGTTIQAALETRRMQVAADLLGRTSFPVKQIAAEVGFENPFYFSQRFRRWAGLSPAQFRASPKPR